MNSEERVDKIVHSMVDGLNDSIRIIRALEKFRELNQPDPIDFIIALSTYTEYCKRDFCRNVAETNVLLDKNPVTKQIVDEITKSEIDPKIIDKAAQVKDPKEIREAVDRVTNYSMNLILKDIENKTIYNKIQSILKRFEH